MRLTSEFALRWTKKHQGLKGSGIKVKLMFKKRRYNQSNYSFYILSNVLSSDSWLQENLGYCLGCDELRLILNL